MPLSVFTRDFFGRLVIQVVLRTLNLGGIKNTIFLNGDLNFR